MDVLDVRGLSTQPTAVVDDLIVDFASSKVYERHALLQIRKKTVYGLIGKVRVVGIDGHLSFGIIFG